MSSPAIHPEIETTSEPTRHTALLLAGVLLVTFAAYAGTMRFEFVYDDGAQIVYNPVVQSWKMVPRMLQQHVWSTQAKAAANYYRPIFLLWCLANFTLFGLKAAWWHLSAVLIHLIATALAFRLAQRISSDCLVAAMTALVFGLHPIHVESVAWISGAGDPLMAAFLFGGFLAYLEFREHRSWPWLVVALACYALACLSKEPGIVLVILIAGFEWIAATRSSFAERTRRALVGAAPFAAVAVLYLVQRHHVLKAFGNPTVDLPLGAIPLTWPGLLWFYAHKLVLPVRLSPFYDKGYVLNADWQAFWMPLILLSLVCALAWWCARRFSEVARPDETYSPRQAAWIALLWIAVPLLPVLDVLGLQPHEIAHDRYLYMSCLGLGILVGMLVRRLKLGEPRVFGLTMAQMAAVVALLALLGTATAEQSGYWANDLLLYYRAVSVAPSSITAANNLANALLDRNYYAEGIKMHEQILKRDPTYWLSYYNLANAYSNMGKLPEATQYMFRAAQLNPYDPSVFLYLGMLQMKQQQWPQAEQNVRTAIRLAPNALGGYYVLGLILEQEGRPADAADAFRQELALDPDQPKVRAELEKVEKR